MTGTPPVLWISVQDAAAVLGCHPSTVNSLARYGALHHDGRLRHRRIDGAALIEFYDAEGPIGHGEPNEAAITKLRGRVAAINAAENLPPVQPPPGSLAAVSAPAVQPPLPSPGEPRRFELIGPGGNPAGVFGVLFDDGLVVLRRTEPPSLSVYGVAEAARLWPGGEGAPAMAFIDA